MLFKVREVALKRNKPFLNLWSKVNLILKSTMNNTQCILIIDIWQKVKWGRLDMRLRLLRIWLLNSLNNQLERRIKGRLISRKWLIEKLSIKRCWRIILGMFGSWVWRIQITSINWERRDKQRLMNITKSIAKLSNQQGVGSTAVSLWWLPRLLEWEHPSSTSLTGTRSSPWLSSYPVGGWWLVVATTWLPKVTSDTQMCLGTLRKRNSTN